ncbi:MAG: hypothetical protein JXB88_24365 [Spirochaetales bacterium]|nr:hypothetical protein [Spirochaetales bacterium]
MKNGSLLNNYLVQDDLTKKKTPVLALVLGGIICIAITSGVFFLEKDLVAENHMVKAYETVKSIVAHEKDFDAILNKIENNSNLNNFTRITLLELAKDPERYGTDFEIRYPHYMEYQYMYSQLLRKDYSDWIGEVISGKADTEFIPNIFHYLSTLKDDRYLAQALSRFNDFLMQSNESGFVVTSHLDAFIIGSLALYCMQFPRAKTKLLKSALAQKIDYFMNSAGKVMGIPLNQIFIAFYIKHNTLESLIIKKMNEFLSSGKKSWDGTSWYKSAVDNLINYFTEIGTGLSRDFYILFETGFRDFDPMRLYIALQVMKKIGFDDPELLKWLDKDYDNFENKLSMYSVDVLGTKSNEQIINFSGEITETRSAIIGRQKAYFSQILAEDVENSALHKMHIPVVTIPGEIMNESLPDQYTKEFINIKIASRKSKHQLILFVATISFLATFLLITSKEKGAFLLTWLFLPVINLLFFFIFWNPLSDFYQLEIPTLILFLFITVIPFAIIFVTKVFHRPGKIIWRFFLFISAEICYLLGIKNKAQYYFKLAGCENHFYSKIYHYSK